MVYRPKILFERKNSIRINQYKLTSSSSLLAIAKNINQSINIKFVTSKYYLSSEASVQAVSPRKR